MAPPSHRPDEPVTPEESGPLMDPQSTQDAAQRPEQPGQPGVQPKRAQPHGDPLAPAARQATVDPQAPPRRLGTRYEVIGMGFSTLARWSGSFVLIALAAILLGLLIGYGWYIIFPILLALIFSTVLSPLSALLRDRLRFPPALAAAVALLSALGVFVGAGFALAPQVAGQSGQIASDVNDGIQQVQDWVQSTDFITADQIDGMLDSVQDFVSGSASQIASGVLVGVTAVGNALITIVLSLVLTFLFLKDGRRFLPWLGHLSGEKAGDHLVEVLARAWRTLGGFIRTQAIVSFVDAFFIGLVLLLVGVPLAIPLAVLTFFAGFVPIVGAVVAGALAVLVALVSNGLVGALIVLGGVIAVQQLESNLMQPWLQAKSMQLHPGVVLLSVTLGSTLFGVTGAFLAVPFAAVAAVLVRYLDEVVRSKTEPTLPPYEGGKVDELSEPEANPRPSAPTSDPATS